jgi:hypothetical protein
MVHPQHSVYLIIPMGLFGQDLTLKWNAALCVLQEKNAKFLLNEHTVPSVAQIINESEENTQIQR